MSPALLGISPDELAAILGGSGKAKAVLGALRAGADPTEPLSDKAKAALRSGTHWAVPIVRQRVDAIDGTIKLLLGLDDGKGIETVLIPEPGRNTLCVSSQVGCGRGCTFCLTATMGLVRSLDAAEIIAQVYAMRSLLPDKPIRNVVFMGMGEPLDNLDEVSRAIALLCDDRAYGFGPRHVTISTVGPSPTAIKKAGALPVRLAWSLHAAEEALRKTLVPTARHSAQSLADAFRDVCREKREPLFVELTLLDGINDRPEDADRAIALFRDHDEVRFNLLPMNPIGDPTLRPSPEDRVLAFKAMLIAAGHFTSVRQSRGREARSACGQLAVLGP